MGSGVCSFLPLRTCIFSDHRTNNLQEEFYFESRPVDPRLSTSQTGVYESESDCILRKVEAVGFTSDLYVSPNSSFVGRGKKDKYPTLHFDAT